MKTLLLIVFLSCLFLPVPASAQLTERRVEVLENRLHRIERASRSWTGAAFVGSVFAAWWAQQTKRNAWLWFFLTLFFAPFALPVLLYKNSLDVRVRT
jgi:hypothetical protein